MKRKKSTMVIPEKAMTEIQARALVNRFLMSNIGSLFCAGEPELDIVKRRWQVPVLMVTPGFIAGQVGEVIVDWRTREILSYTNAEEIYAIADKLRKRNHAAIKTAFLRARKG